jgi:7 transmembrane sweet-taste receptor of 3 GCPR
MMSFSFFSQNVLSHNVLLQCFNGTQMEVVPLDLADDRQLLTGQPHTFRLRIQANVSDINQQIAIHALNGRSTIFFRLLLCDAIKKGFCNPLIDSRNIDSQLKPYQTDVGVTDESRDFPEDASRWVYDENTTLRGLTEDDGVLVFSRWCRWSLKQVTPENPVFNATVDISLQLPEQGVRSGAYFFIGHTVLNFDLGGEGANATFQRVDVAKAIPNNVVEIRNPPTIATVTSAMKIGLAVAIGLFGAIAGAMCLFIVVQRNHAVMRLAQGSFLAAIAGACCFQIGGSFAFLPTHDIFCRLQGPLVFVPMTFVASCLVGRIWRVYKVLSVMNQFARLESPQTTSLVSGDCLILLLSFLARLPLRCKKYSQQSNSLRRSHRQTVSAEETASLIVLLTLPQVLIQVLGSALVPNWDLVEELESSGNVGRIVCDSIGDWVLATGIAYTAAVFLLAVAVAWISRTLPSAFNEKVQIFHAASISTLLAFVTISLVSISSDPTTHPDIQVSVFWFYYRICSGL